MRIFNRVAAVEYALKWALGRNPAYRDHSRNTGGGGDCTNFVSQVMLAGGWPQVPAAVPVPWNNNFWFSDGSSGSHSWAGAVNFQKFLKISGRAAPCGRNELTFGDIVFQETDHPIHTMVVTHAIQVSHLHPEANNEIFLSYHSLDRKNWPFWQIEEKYKESGHKRPFTYWKVADLIPESPNYMRIKIH